MNNNLGIRVLFGEITLNYIPFQDDDVLCVMVICNIPFMRFFTGGIRNRDVSSKMLHGILEEHKI